MLWSICEAVPTSREVSAKRLKWRGYLVLVAALTAGVVVPTAPAQAEGPGWTPPGTVTKIVVTFNGGVNIRMSPDVNNCISQSGYGANYASVYPTHPGINRIKADVLAAYLTGKPISLYLTDSSCTVGEVVLGGFP